MAARTPIFVLCCARSGSTLLRYVLDSHPEICAPPELHLLPAAQQLVWIHTHTGIEPGVGATQGKAAHAAVAETRRHIDRIMGGYAGREGKSSWCEKSVASIDCLDALDAVFPDARIVCLYRDPRDTAASCQEVLERHSGGFGFEPYVAKDADAPAAGLLEYWCDKTNAALAYAATKTGSCCVVRYEDLVLHPDATLADLATGLGVDAPAQWAATVFNLPHRPGPGDPKILATSSFDKSSIGRGAGLDLSGVPDHIIERTRKIAKSLGYEFPDQ